MDDKCIENVNRQLNSNVRLNELIDLGANCVSICNSLSFSLPPWAYACATQILTGPVWLNFALKYAYKPDKCTSADAPTSYHRKHVIFFLYRRRTWIFIYIESGEQCSNSNGPRASIVFHLNAWIRSEIMAKISIFPTLATKCQKTPSFSVHVRQSTGSHCQLIILGAFTLEHMGNAQTHLARGINIDDEMLLSVRLYKPLVYRFDFSSNLLALRWQMWKSPERMANNEYSVCTQWSDMGQTHTLCTHSHKNKQTSNEVTMDSCASTIHPAPRRNRQKKAMRAETRAHYKSKLTACLLSCALSCVLCWFALFLLQLTAHIAQTSRNYPRRLIYTFYTIPLLHGFGVRSVRRNMIRSAFSISHVRLEWQSF